jgi:hypothetical protein
MGDVGCIKVTTNRQHVLKSNYMSAEVPINTTVKGLWLES